ncbi:MAG: hypothetical protein ACK5NK_10335 [Niabella sp.]
MFYIITTVWKGGTPIFNLGEGKVLMEQKRPALPWSPIQHWQTGVEFSNDSLGFIWYSVRIPENKFYQLTKGR